MERIRNSARGREEINNVEENEKQEVSWKRTNLA